MPLKCESQAKVRPLKLNFCGDAPVLVTVTLQLSGVPGAATAFNWLVENRRVLPAGVGEVPWA